tara:strand:+ start:116 stop:391 length:276 start_codon:yes stop_codon:yes gene_type:complete
MNYHASQFLKKEGIIKEGHTSFFIQFEDGSQIELTEVLAKYSKDNYHYAQEIRNQLSQGRDYLMQVEGDDSITVEDTLEAFGFGRNGLDKF